MCQLTGVSAYRVCQLISALASLKGAAAEGPSLSDSFKRPHPARTHVSHSEHTERQTERERARTHIYRTHYISSRDARAHSHTHPRVRTLPRAAPDYFSCASAGCTPATFILNIISTTALPMARGPKSTERAPTHAFYNVCHLTTTRALAPARSAACAGE